MDTEPQSLEERLEALQAENEQLKSVNQTQSEKIAILTASYSRMRRRLILSVMVLGVIGLIVLIGWFPTIFSPPISNFDLTRTQIVNLNATTSALYDLTQTSIAKNGTLIYTFTPTLSPTNSSLSLTSRAQVIMTATALSKMLTTQYISPTPVPYVPIIRNAPVLSMPACSDELLSQQIGQYLTGQLTNQLSRILDVSVTPDCADDKLDGNLKITLYQQNISDIAYASDNINALVAYLARFEVIDADRIHLQIVVQGVDGAEIAFDDNLQHVLQVYQSGLRGEQLVNAFVTTQ